MKSMTLRQLNNPIKLIALLLLTVGLLLVAYFTLSANTASAADKKDWLAGNIISDANFTDKNAMSTSQIQSFLNQKIGSCDMWGTGKAVEFGSNLTRAQYAKSRGWPAPPYVCLNKYYEVPKITPTSGSPVNNFNKTAKKPSGSKSAAWIIKDAANRYNISPKVLLVKIATESAGPLTSDKWPLESQYRYAMGSNCPDSGPGGSANCDDSYAGFSIQMYSAAALLRSYLDNMDEPWWSLKRPGKGNYVGWNVAQSSYYSSSQKKWLPCGGTNLTIKNKATAALYTYTPYQPNNAALDNMYTAVPHSNGFDSKCAAYGNRNFWRVYTDWFGPTRITIKGSIKNYYDSNDGESLFGAPLANETGDGHGFYWQKFEKGYIAGRGTTGYYAIRGSIGKFYDSYRKNARKLGAPMSNENGDDNGTNWQRFEGGEIIGRWETGYWESVGSIRESWLALGSYQGTLGLPRAPEKKLHGDGGGWYQRYENGYILGRSSTGYWESSGPIRDYWLSNGSHIGSIGYPTGPIIEEANGDMRQSYVGGVIEYEGSSRRAYFVNS